MPSDTNNAHIISISSDQTTYPARLKRCPVYPQVIHTIGTMDLNKGHFVSVVGTRRATENAKDWTHQFVRELASCVPDVTIVSGLAYGIDVEAHKAAMEEGVQTIAVLGHGLDRIYPYAHRSIAVKMLDNGGLVTQYPLKTEVQPYFFSERDKIIAGLADVTVVVESPAKGGSLITAQAAYDYGRVVMAFPGRVTDAMSAGCNALIRDQKARLITCAADLVRIMEWEGQMQPVQTEIENLFETVDDTGRQILMALRSSEDGVHINQLVEDLQQPYSVVSSSLMMLELDGFVRSLPGGVYRACK